MRNCIKGGSSGSLRTTAQGSEEYVSVVITLLIIRTKYLVKAAWRERGDFGSQFEDGEVTAAGPCGCWSHCVHKQEAESNKY